MLIMPCRASASRYRAQVTSNVRHPKSKKFKDKKDTRFGKVVPEDILHSAKSVQVGRNGNGAARGQKIDGAKFDPQKLVKNCALCFSPSGASRRTTSQVPRPCVIQVVGPAAIGGKSVTEPQTAAPGKANDRATGLPSSTATRAMAASKTWSPHCSASQGCLTLR
jgi:hypothetical protein